MIREAALVATKRALVTNSPSGLFQRFSRTILRSQERLGSCRGSGLLGLSEQKQKGRGISSIERNQRYRAASENAVQVLRKARGIHRIRSARFSTGKDLEAETMAFPPYDENNIFKKIINGGTIFHCCCILMLYCRIIPSAGGVRINLPSSLKDTGREPDIFLIHHFIIHSFLFRHALL